MTWALFHFPTTNPERFPMFIPLLAAAAVATTFAQLGAMSVQIAVLTLALKTMTVALLAVVIAAIALSWQSRRMA